MYEKLPLFKGWELVAKGDVNIANSHRDESQ